MNRPLLVLLAAAVGLGAAVWVHQPSAIVQRVERAGSGPLESLSVDDLMVWFDAGHQEVARSVAPLCVARSQHVPARWTVSLEGRVCRAAVHSVSLADLNDSVYVPTN